MKIFKTFILFSQCLSVALLLGACSTTKQRAMPGAQQQPLLSKPVSKLEWDGPCEREHKLPKGSRLSGFKVRVLDPSKKVMAEKFLPIKKNDPFACNSYAFHFKDLPNDLAKALEQGKFKGWLTVSSVTRNKVESSPAMFEYPPTGK